MLGGWSLAPMFVFQSGQPWDMPGNVDLAPGVDLKDIALNGTKEGQFIYGVKPCVGQLQHHHRQRTICCRTPIAYGCTQPYFLIRQAFQRRTTMFRYDEFRRPIYWEVDMNIAKTTQITDKVRFQVRIEAFNIFNSPMYDERAVQAGHVVGGLRPDQPELTRASRTSSGSFQLGFRLILLRVLRDSGRRRASPNPRFPVRPVIRLQEAHASTRTSRSPRSQSLVERPSATAPVTCPAHPLGRSPRPHSTTRPGGRSSIDTILCRVSTGSRHAAPRRVSSKVISIALVFYALQSTALHDAGADRAGVERQGVRRGAGRREPAAVSGGMDVGTRLACRWRHGNARAPSSRHFGTPDAQPPRVLPRHRSTSGAGAIARRPSLLRRAVRPRDAIPL